MSFLLDEINDHTSGSMLLPSRLTSRVEGEFAAAGGKSGSSGFLFKDETDHDRSWLATQLPAKPAPPKNLRNVTDFDVHGRTPLRELI